MEKIVEFITSCIIIVSFTFSIVGCGGYKPPTPPVVEPQPVTGMATPSVAPITTVAATPVTATPYKWPELYKNARAMTVRDDAWISTGAGIKLIIRQLNGRCEGGEGVWDLRVIVLAEDNLTVTMAKTDQYGVKITDIKWTQKNGKKDALSFDATLRAPLEFSSDNGEAEAHVTLEFTNEAERGRVREVTLPLDDLRVRKMTSRITVSARD